MKLGKGEIQLNYKKPSLTANIRDGKQDAGKTLEKGISVTMCMMED